MTISHTYRVHASFTYFRGMAFSSEVYIQSIPFSAAFSRGSPTYNRIMDIVVVWDTANKKVEND